jgi:hypothetical protein
VAAVCRSYASHAEALDAVNAVLEAGFDGDGVLVLTGEPPRDGRAVGSFAGAPHAQSAGMGAFAGGAQRGGSFADADREHVVSYPEGVERMHVAGHRRVGRLLRDAGLDADTAARDIAALHAGRVVVLVDVDGEPEAARAGALLDG